MSGISFSNLFVDITNKRQQETAKQMSQVMGAIDQIAAHKKQQRLTTERDDLLKDNEEHKLQKRQQKMFTDNMDIWDQYSDEDVSTLKGEGEWTNETLDLLGQDIARRKIKAKTAEDDRNAVNEYQKATGETPYKDDKGNWMVDIDGKPIDADEHRYNLAQEKNIATATKTLNKKTSAERQLDEWYTKKGWQVPEGGYIEAKRKQKEYSEIEKKVAEFPSHLKVIYDDMKLVNHILR